MKFCRYTITLSYGAIVCCRPMPCALHPVKQIEPAALKRYLDARPL